MHSLSRRVFCATAAAGAAHALQVNDKAFSGAWTPERLAAQIPPIGKWTPFPKHADRAAWEAIPADVRASVLAESKAAETKPWGDLPAALYLEFKRTGNRSHYEDVSFARRGKLATLVAAECLEGKGRLLDEIVNGIWLICEESFWGVPAAAPTKDGLPDVLSPTLELFAGETVALLAWTDYLLGAQLDTVSPAVRKRLRVEAGRRIIDPGLSHDDYGWMGLRSKAPVNNWNPWICSNWLVATLLLEPDPARRTASIHKILRCLDRFVAGYPEDGGCDEGPGYWYRAGASLFEALEWLRSGSGGALNYLSMPLVKEIGSYIYRVHIAGDWSVNFADAPAKVAPSGDLIYRFGRAVGDPRMMAFGAWGQRKPFTSRDALGRVLPALFNVSELRQAKAAPPLLRDFWFPQLQVMTARLREGTTDGLYVAAQGGHNAESHNHNDVGNFIVYSGGEPVIVDIGVERYTAKTFSAQRYDIWTMQSAFHNCPTVNGVMQMAGKQFRATEVDYQASDAATELRMNIEKAYPPAAGLRSWTRSIRLDRSADRVVIADRYAMDAPPKEITLTLMTPREPTVAAGRVTLRGEVKISFDPAMLSARVEKIPLTDPSLKKIWSGTLYRVLLAAVQLPREGSFEVRIEPVSTS